MCLVLRVGREWWLGSVRVGGLICTLMKTNFVVTYRPSSRPRVDNVLANVRDSALLMRSFPMGSHSDHEASAVTVRGKDFTFGLNSDMLGRICVCNGPSIGPGRSNDVPTVSVGTMGFLLLPNRPVGVSNSLSRCGLRKNSFCSSCGRILRSYGTCDRGVSSLGMIYVSVRGGKVPKSSVHGICTSTGR